MSGDGKIDMPVTLRLDPAVAEWLKTFAYRNGNTPGAEASIMVFHTKAMVEATDSLRNRKANGWR